MSGMSHATGPSSVVMILDCLSPDSARPKNLLSLYPESFTLTIAAVLATSLLLISSGVQNVSPAVVGTTHSISFTSFKMFSSKANIFFAVSAKAFLSCSELMPAAFRSLMEGGSSLDTAAVIRSLNSDSTVHSFAVVFCFHTAASRACGFSVRA